jgi:hypothetical protein
MSTSRVYPLLQPNGLLTGPLAIEHIALGSGMVIEVEMAASGLGSRPDLEGGVGIKAHV